MEALKINKGHLDSVQSDIEKKVKQLCQPSASVKKCCCHLKACEEPQESMPPSPGSH